MTKNNSTEQKIFEAATQLFLEKGVDRTSVREIATKANINLALMNYYFRSKENLFDAIFSKLVKSNSKNLIEILDSDLELAMHGALGERVRDASGQGGGGRC